MEEYGLVGFPLKHSFSQKFFTEKFALENIDARYSKFEIADINDIIAIIKSNDNIVGFNVTIPHKQNVMQLLDVLSDEAKEIGAVNVVKIDRNKDGKNGSKLFLTGYNSDVYGFEKSLTPLLEGRFNLKSLILGTGGASKAVAYTMKKLNIPYKYVSRAKKDGMFIYRDINEAVMKEYHLIINATPIGTFPDIDACPSIPYGYITNQHILYDLVYNPEVTLFLQKGKEQLATIKNGYEMLVLQALQSWNIWTK